MSGSPERGASGAVVLVLLIGVAAVAAAWLWMRPGDPGTASPSGPSSTDSAAAPAALPPAASASISSLLQAMQSLESNRDPKCHSTACRFENFVYGTPLTDQGRDRKVELQKELVHAIWSQASAAASAAGEMRVGVDRIRAGIAERFLTEMLSTGDIQVTFPGRPALVLSQVRARQYGSIAYSLRAILGLQQDLLLGGGELLLALDTQAVDELREALDTVTLCALLLADESARQDSLAQIGDTTLGDAWRSLIKAPEGGPVAKARANPGSAQIGMQLLLDLVKEKKAAFKAYNENPDDRAFFSNVERFYALLAPPPMQKGGAQVLAFFTARVVDFTRELLIRSREIALENGHSLIRSADAARAMDELAPHSIDHFEDSHFFFHLPREQRVSLESYDTDSFRDFGMHWVLFERALKKLPHQDVPPDPFAAEVLTEAISQYGVLLFRVTGMVARERQAGKYFREQDLTRAQQRIAELASRHHAAARADSGAAGIRSSEQAASIASAAPGESFFSDVSAASGLEYRHRSSAWLSDFRRKFPANPPSFSGGGIAAGDVDGDADIDLLLVGGSGSGLFLNDGSGIFQDVTEQAGIRLPRPDGNHGEGRQPILADFDNDGRLDILVTFVDDDHHLFQNQGDGRFENVSATAGLGGKGLIGGPATVFDFDNDGLLDIYICYFGNYLKGVLPKANRSNRNALPNALFRNLGGFRFEDVTASSGTGDLGWAQAVSHTDLDRDGNQDIVIGNDYGINAFLKNLGGGRFRDVAADLGITKAYHSMNVDYSDLNQDGFPEVYVSNIATMVKDNKYVLPDVNTPLKFEPEAMANMLIQEASMLYMSQSEDGRLVGYEPSDDIERGATSTGWAWDAKFFDHDLDGDDDLYVLNGTNDYAFFYSVAPFEDESGKTSHLYLSHARQSNVFFVNEGGRLNNRSDLSGLDYTGNSRSAAYFDMDGDGDLDVAVNDFHAPARLFKNEADRLGRHWMKVQLVGNPDLGSNRDAIGARIIATTADGVRVWREIHGGSGYLSMNPTLQHFGLGAAEQADLEITWPDGEVQLLKGLQADRTHTIVRGE